MSYLVTKQNIQSLLKKVVHDFHLNIRGYYNCAVKYMFSLICSMRIFCDKVENIL